MAGMRGVAGNAKHPLKDRGHDLYETPEQAVAALLMAEDLPHTILEPACGPGAIVRVLRAAGHTVHATDLIDYQCPDSRAGIDFLMGYEIPSDVQAIVTNPPFKLAEQFVAHARSLCPKVYMLLRLGFLESERRRAILESGDFARVHIFRNRLPLMHRAGWTGPRASSGMAFGWFVWDADHQGPATLHRISWS